MQKVSLMLTEPEKRLLLKLLQEGGSSCVTDEEVVIIRSWIMAGLVNYKQITHDRIRVLFGNRLGKIGTVLLTEN